MVVALGIDVDRWTVQQLLDAMDHARAELGWIERPERIRSKLGHFFQSAKYALLLARLAQRQPKPKPAPQATPAAAHSASIEDDRRHRERLEADPLWQQARAAFFEHIREPSATIGAATPPPDPLADARAAARAELARLRNPRR